MTRLERIVVAVLLASFVVALYFGREGYVR